jgi:transposase
MSCKNRLTLEYKKQDVEKLVRDNPDWSIVKLNDALVKKWGSGIGSRSIAPIKKRVVKEIGYKKPKPKYEHRKKPSNTGFWG